MQIVIAMDSFKGSLSSMEAGNAAAQGIRRVYPDADIIVCPLADGGEGTTQALVTGLHGTYRSVTVQDPLGRPIRAATAFSRIRRQSSKWLRPPDCRC